ncbi:MAG TPA: NAD-dependent epimerase/dehydratase family protein [Bacteroidota bacterium]|nr:NAD-dependent epimerase/dehydratase family protein [Bacteroidota bacterium]
MLALITGATGFIGSHLAEQLHAKGYRLRCLVRPTSDRTHLRDIPVEYAEGTLSDTNALRAAVTGCDYVYHLAGVTKAKTPGEYERGNHLATRNLLEAVVAANPGLRRFVHVSSQAAVGPSPPGGTIDESTPFHPLTTYGRTKMAAEKECHAMEGRLPITIVRPPAVYGPRDKDIFEFFNTMNRGLQPMIGFNTKLVSLIHAGDLARGIILAGETERAAGQTYFIASERYYNWKEVGEVTARILGKKAVRLRIPETVVYGIAAAAELYSVISGQAVLLNWEKATDLVQDAWTCRIDKAKAELGFRETFTLETGIADTVGWYRKNGWLK